VNPRRLASIVSALAVAGIAALASYSHMRGLALRYGQDDLIATLLPISVDGMITVAAIALGDGRRHRWSAWLAFWTGVAASVIANVLAAQPSAIARCISAWPAVAFLLVVEVITRGGRARKSAPAAPTSAAVPAAGQPTGEAGKTGTEPDTAQVTPAAGPPVANPPAATRAAKRPSTDAAASPPPTGSSSHGGTGDGADRAGGTAGPVRGRSPARRPTGTPAVPGPDVSDLMPAGRAVRDRLAAAGQAMTRDELVAGLRAAGHTVSSKRASALYAALRDGNDGTDSAVKASQGLADFDVMATGNGSGHLDGAAVADTTTNGGRA
jgi:hypothetical protein